MMKGVRRTMQTFPDFDETGFYKGFVKNQKGKKFPGRDPQLLTLSEVDAFDSFSGVMFPNAILISSAAIPSPLSFKNTIPFSKV